MLLTGSTLLHAPILGIQTGGELARTTHPVIDPATLAIVAFELDNLLQQRGPLLLRTADIRECSDIGIIIDSEDEFIAPDDVIKIQEVYAQNFYLLGMHVTDENRRKLGKVIDFTVEAVGFTIQQLTVKRPLLKSLNDTELLIHRSQIIEINDKAIVVHSQAKAPEPELHEVVGSYVNPFRKSSKPAPESIASEERP